MFLVHLLPSMQEAVGARNHKTAVAMVRAMDALWDAQSGHDPTVLAATTHHSRSPAPAMGRKNNRRTGKAPSKSHPPSSSDFFSFQNQGNGICKFHNLRQQGTQVHFTLLLFRKLKQLGNMEYFSLHVLCWSIWPLQAPFKYPFQFFFSAVIRSLFNYYSIIVRLLFSILILEMYSRYFDPVKK
jgi:hypothetical protein